MLIAEGQPDAENVTIKGQTFALHQFLGPMTIGTGSRSEYGTRDILTDAENNCLYACVIYLSPSDCHRFFSPTDWTVSFARHFKGQLFLFIESL